MHDRIRTSLDDSGNVNVRKPIFNLSGFNEEELDNVSKQIIEMHSVAYDWDANKKFESAIDEIIQRAIDDASLTDGKVTPRIFIRQFIEALDVVEQNPDNFKTSSDIIALFNFEEKPDWGFDDENEAERDIFDDW